MVCISYMRAAPVSVQQKCSLRLLNSAAPHELLSGWAEENLTPVDQAGTSSG